MLQGTDQFRKRSTTWSAVQPPGSDSTYLLGTGGSCARRHGRTPARYRIVYTGAPGISERNHATVAQKIQTLFIDDLDGSAAEGTVRFGLDGTEYEIDLNDEHARELREALARYAGAARPLVRV
jgi:hypothetical protein